MSDVLLIEPRAGVSNRSWNWLPLGLLAVSAPLVNKGYRVAIIDQRISEDWKKQISSALKDRKDLLCVGITAMTSPQIIAGLKISAYIKSLTDSSIPIVWGGIHPSLVPEQTINHPLIDMIVIGEGEKTFSELVQALEHNRSLYDIAGIWFKERSENPRAKIGRSKKIHRNPPRKFIDLNSIPDPPYKLLDNIENYIHPWYELKKTFDIVTSRGCPYNCAFCYNTVYNHRKWRALSPKRVINLIRDITDHYKVRTIGFADDNFFGSIKRADIIMKQMIKESLDVELYYHGVRIDTLAKLDNMQLKRLIKAGSRYFQIGAESGSDRILKFINDILPK